MLYCKAAPVVKFIPYSQTEMSRCGNGRHRYCDVYLSVVNAGAPDGRRVDGILLPDHVSFAPNHLWFENGEDECWHVGVDDFLARLLGRVERLTFLPPVDRNRPAAVLTVRGVDLQMVFPEALPGAEAHYALRATPSRINEDPYGSGWLFEGSGPTPGGLATSEEAEKWMRAEVDRLSRWVHDHLARIQPGLLNDGGLFSEDLVSQLERDEVLALFHNFFSPYARWERSR